MKIHVFVNGLDEWFEELEIVWYGALKRLALPENALPLVRTTAKRASLGSDLAVFFAAKNRAGRSKGLNKRSTQLLKKHVDAGNVVVPVVDSVQGFRAKVPSALGNINAVALGTKERDYTRLVSELIDRAWHFRLKRKLFISYRRVDSQAVARQLQSTLTNRGYEVFLDESTIRAGADFQRELMAWLNDADFVLVLASPGMGDSKWVLEELNAANLAYVGILAVSWPETTPEAVSALLHRDHLTLAPTDFKDLAAPPDAQEIKPAKLKGLVDTIERFRAQAIETRLENLAPLFVRKAEAAGFTVAGGKRLGDFVLSKANKPAAYVRIVPFRPTVSTMNDLSRDIGKNKPPEKAACFYNENDRNYPQTRSLEWALEPERPETENGPRVFKLLPYTGDASLRKLL